MGITNFHTWFKQKFPNAFYQLVGNNVYDNIYIDINFLLHNAIYESKNYPDFMKKFFNQLNIIFSNFIAKERIIFAIDGPSPYAKVLLQRKRRQSSNKKDIVDLMHPLSLTPGTELMYKIEESLHVYSQKLLKKYKFIKPIIEIISFEDPDEGEIKICKKVLEYGKDHLNKKHLIVGNDADIVVLSMAMTPIYNINILIRINGMNELISIKKLIDATNIAFNNANHDNIYNSKIRADFVIMMLMMGNDYLPKIGFINFDKLYDTYVQFRKVYDTFLFDDDKFNVEALKDFLFMLFTNVKKHKRMDIKSYDYKSCENYFNGLLWCYNIYNTGQCLQYDFAYDSKYSPSLNELIFYLHSADYLNKTPMSNALPIPIDVYSLIVLPKSAKKLIPVKFHTLMENQLKYLFNDDQCLECNQIHADMSKYYKQLYQLQKKELDTEECRKNISVNMKKLKDHKGAHQVGRGFEISDIKNIIALSKKC